MPDIQSISTISNGLQKWHALDHIFDAIREVGDRTFLHTSHLESSHKQFTSEYSFSSEKASVVFEEFAEKETEEER